MPVVYVDVLFLVNFIMDYIVAATVAVLMKSDTKQRRLILSSALGALYSVGIFFCDISFLYSLAAKFIVSLILVWITFSPKGRKNFIKYVIGFYGTNILFGGTVFVSLYMTGLGTKIGAVVKNGVIYFDISIIYLLAASGFAYMLITIYIKGIKGGRKRQFYNIEIGVNGKNTILRALVDTGNALFEQSTGLTVVVAENTYTDEIINLQKDGQKIYIIPFKALGTDGGVIMGFRPDYMRIIQDGKYISDVIVGVYDGKLSANEDYHALINPSAI